MFFREQTHLLFTFLLLEKVSAVNIYDPPPEVVAVRDHMTHVVNSMSQPQRIFDRYLLGPSTGRTHARNRQDCCFL